MSSLLLLATVTPMVFLQEDPPVPVTTPDPPVDAVVTALDTLMGKGRSVQDGDIATVTYRGWLPTTGKDFDSSNDKPPFAFKVGSTDVIMGWNRGILGMKIGGKRIISVPPALGYGNRAVADIPANSTLVFEVELHRIDSAEGDSKATIENLAAGKGKAAAKGDVVDVHYTGTFLNGKKFDSSRDRNQPIRFELGANRVIPGFDQGVIGMMEGGKRRVTIPFNLGYGENGRPPVIPRYATLVFELELVKIR